ncbi:MAG: SBBP repeat-containing protein [Bacteroidota bacterium]
MIKRFSSLNFDKVKIIVLCVATGFLMFSWQKVIAQSPNWIWAKKAGGFSNELINSVATDASGNVYVAGYFYDYSLIFGSTTLNCAGFYDIFLAKYDANGNVIWAKRAGENEHDASYSIATDNYGNVYVVGSFISNTITFGTITLTNLSIFNDDMFIVKYDPSGNVIWAKSTGGIALDKALSVTTDTLGNVYVTGVFGSNSIVFGSDTLTNSGTFNSFLTKYDSSGNVIWAKSLGGSFYDYSNSVATDASGYVYIGGYLASDTVILGSDTLSNSGAADIFLAKYDPSGNVIWAKRAGGISDDEVNSVATDAWDKIYITGYFESDTMTVGSATLSNAGSKDMFIAAYDSSGNAVWANSAGGITYDEAFSIATDAPGNVYVTGSFNGSTITFGSDTLTNAGMSNIFLAKFDPSGNINWAKSAGGITYDVAYSVATDASGNVFVGGIFSSPSISFGSTVLTGNDNELFIAKLNTINGVEKLQSNFEARVYPNPANRIFTIQIINDELRNINYELIVYNMLGEKVFSKKADTDKTEIDLSNQPGGAYFIKAVIEDMTLNQKIFITGK